MLKWSHCVRKVYKYIFAFCTTFQAAARGFEISLTQ